MLSNTSFMCASHSCNCSAVGKVTVSGPGCCSFLKQQALPAQHSHHKIHRQNTHQKKVFRKQVPYVHTCWPLAPTSASHDTHAALSPQLLLEHRMLLHTHAAINQTQSTRAGTRHAVWHQIGLGNRNRIRPKRNIQK